MFKYNIAAHIEGLRHLPICLFETPFSCQCPFKTFDKKEWLLLVILLGMILEKELKD
jgi:hypothetical protein